MKIVKSIVLLLAIIVFVAFNNNSSSNELEKIIAQYEAEREYDFKRNQSVENTIKFHQLEADFAKNLLEKLNAITDEGLSESETISKELLAFVLQDKIDRNTYKMHLNPITNEIAFHLNLGNMGNKSLKNKKDVVSYLNDLDSLPLKIDYNLNLLRAGINAGVSQPKEAFPNYDITYNKHIVSDVSKSDFYKPFLSLPEDFSESFKDSVLNVAKISVQKNAIDQYKKIKAFFVTEYFPKTRKGLGVGTIKNGKEFYQNRINYYTTSIQYTAEDIHQIGLKEVARIKAEMQKIIKDLAFDGSFEDFLEFLRTDEQFYPKTAKELLMFARDISKRIDAELPKYFKTLPRKPYGVEPVPEAIAPNYTSGRYSGTRDDDKAGFYWVNTYNLPSRTLYTIPALTAHEAVPGHHLQMSLNNELPKTIPQFRRDLYLSAYGEGWALYTETLADEMGIYTTPYEKFGKYTYEMWRACRLVVDTGIHAKGWTRQQVIDYMASNTALSIHEVTTETDRYITWPGQAISYKMGEIKIRELREKAEKELGDKFDIREFHEIILGQGTVTLSILENRLLNYINKVKNG
ncbi:Uncharacterized conserved protein, DUF885 familyt [Hyunsoonleella jejuensis]|uniref:Uncharacterized conserved protein, DUF885 familyt n=1 Tax=Hyunsoonleella jejuensis TaxID=419940 RepID=A0A1H9CBY6_9FLAO|nr:DUF885 domain-containing protein [Hyunsoonleella jejuensis]SEP98521.1 Uncharacterized conserved protein, DUF885 familyt [Hyunsoonleella jejuensis]